MTLDWQVQKTAMHNTMIKQLADPVRLLMQSSFNAKLGIGASSTKEHKQDDLNPAPKLTHDIDTEHSVTA